jgi:hypothetical protein
MKAIADSPLPFDCVSEFQRLRGQVRRLQWLTGTLVLSLVVAGVVGAGRPDRPVAPRVLDAEKVVLRSADGKVRGAWRTDATGKAEMVFFDRDGVVRLACGIKDDGEPAVTLSGRGVQRAAMRLRGEMAELSFHDRKGGVCFFAGAKSDGTSGLAFLDARRVIRFKTEVQPSGDSSLTYQDQDGHMRLSLGGLPNGNALFCLLDPVKQVRLALVGGKDGYFFRVMDPSGRTLSETPPR